MALNRNLLVGGLPDAVPAILSHPSLGYPLSLLHRMLEDQGDDNQIDDVSK